MWELVFHIFWLDTLFTEIWRGASLYAYMKIWIIAIYIDHISHLCHPNMIRMVAKKFPITKKIVHPFFPPQAYYNFFYQLWFRGCDYSNVCLPYKSYHSIGIPNVVKIITNKWNHHTFFKHLNCPYSILSSLEQTIFRPGGHINFPANL